jgi:hypothetical protein
MKKFIAIPLLILYLVAVSGMMVQIHFCGSKISSWAVSEKKASCCCETSGKESRKSLSGASSDDCCKDKTITLKIAQEQYRANDIQSQMQALQIAYLPQQFYAPPVIDLPVHHTEQVYQANAPPGRWQNIPLYKLHSSFTYYG